MRQQYFQQNSNFQKHIMIFALIKVQKEHIILLEFNKIIIKMEIMVINLLVKCKLMVLLEVVIK